MKLFRELVEFKKTDRTWHLPVLAGLCVGIPVLIGYYTGHLVDGKLASMAGLVILYMQVQQQMANQLIKLMACSFGLMVSFAIGSIASFHPLWSCLILGIYAFTVHLALFYLKMNKPPGNFFFIMIASVAVCLPHDLAIVPHRIGLVGIGTMTSCLLAFLFFLLMNRRMPAAPETITVSKSRYVNLIESVTFGFFVGAALLAGRLLKLDNPYWIPTSCAAVMQGVSVKHVWQRSVQRILGTFVGLVLTWAILLLHPPVPVLCLSIVLLQIIVEILVVRNYGLAVILITVLTIFLAESGAALTSDPNTLLTTRFIDIFVGSAMGSLGGWILYNEKLQFAATRQLRKTKVILSKLKE
jgi:hypothetical protein